VGIRDLLNLVQIEAEAGMRRQKRQHVPVLDLLKACEAMMLAARPAKDLGVLPPRTSRTSIAPW
jgi:hypothetical protein